MKVRIILAFVSLLLTNAQAASFDCVKATSIAERLICASKKLSGLDEELDKSYKAAVRNASPKEKTKVIADQKAWLKKTRDECSQESCLEVAYAIRIKALNSDGTPLGSEPCGYLSLVSIKQTPMKNNGETLLGELCSDEYAPPVCDEPIIRKSDLVKRGFRLDDPATAEMLATGETYTTWISEVDIDNDGTPELRFRTVQGTLSCVSQIFFKIMPDGRYALMQHGGYDSFDDAARTCPGDFLFPKYLGTVYVVNATDSRDTIWRGSPAGITEICSR